MKPLLLSCLLAISFVAQAQTTTRVPEGGFPINQDRLKRTGTGWIDVSLRSLDDAIKAIGTGGAKTFDQILGKPQYYPSSIALVALLQDALDAKQSVGFSYSKDVTDAKYLPIGYKPLLSDVQNLQQALDLKINLADSWTRTQADGRYKPIGYAPTFTIGQITTIPFGQTPTGSFTGTADNPVLNLQLPAGQPGANASADPSTVTQVNGVNPSGGAVNLTTDNVPEGPTRKYVGPVNVQAITDPLYLTKSDNAVQQLLKTDALTLTTFRSAAAVAPFVAINDGSKQDLFYYDATDTQSSDDGVTVIVSGTKRYKLYYNGPLEADRFGLVANGVGDDAPGITLALARSNEVTLRAGRTYGISRLQIPNGKTLIIPKGTTVKLLPLTPAQLSSYGTEFGGIEPGIFSTLTGSGTIDGNKANRAEGFGIYSANKAGGFTINGHLRMVNMANDNIKFQNLTLGGVLIENVTMSGGNDRGIHGVITSGVQIKNVKVDGGTHGIQWWGDLTNGRCERWTITDAQVSNLSGAGVWGFRGRGITVQGGSAITCNDICYDAEETDNITFTGVYAKDGLNSAYGIYNGSKNVTFNGVIGNQGPGKGPAIKVYSPNVAGSAINANITFTGGIMTTADDVPVINTDQQVVENMTVDGVRLTGGYAQFLDATKIKFINNVQTTAGNLGVFLLGTTNSIVAGNTFFYTGSTPSAANEGRFTYRSSTFTGGNNRIENNHAYGFAGGYWDDNNGGPTTSSGNIFLSNETGAAVKSDRTSLRKSGNYLASGVQLDVPSPSLSAVSLGTNAYAPILTLPASTNGTYDFTNVVVSFGAWGGSETKVINLMTGNRDSLYANYTRQGSATAGGNLTAYRNTDNTVTFWVELPAFYRVTVTYLALVQSTPVQSINLTETPPTGTNVFGLGTTSPSNSGGTTPNFSIGTVTKIAPGGTPTVTRTGTAENPVLNFGLVTGDAATAPVFTGTAQIVFDGNSVVYGKGSTSPAANENDFAGNNFPAVARRALVSAFPGVTFTTKNFGVDGQTTQQMASDAVSQIDALYSGTYDRNILVVREISNDISLNNTASSTAYQTFVNYCQARRAAGWRVLFLTLTPRSVAPSTMTLTDYNNRKDAVNGLLRKNWPLFSDGIIDVATLSGLNYPDGVHTDDAGYAQFGAMTATKVGAIVQNGFNPTSIPPVTVASSTTTTVTSSTLLVLNGTGTNGSTVIQDASPYNRSVTNNGVTISTAQAKFGSSSLFFNGSDGVYLEVPSSTDFDLGTGDFTLETWFYATAWSSGGPVSPFFARTNGTTVQWTFNVRTGGASTALNVRTADNTGYLSPGPSNSTAAPALNSWHHYAVVSTGGARKLYIDGVLSATSTSLPSMETNTSSQPIRIGSLTSQDKLSGYGHFRFTKTALYTANFTPPTSF